MHKLECEALRRWAAAAPPHEADPGKDMNMDDDADVVVPGEAVRCLARILWKRRKEGSDSIWVSGP